MAQVLVTLGVALVAVICLSAVIVVAWTVWRHPSGVEPAASRIPAAAASDTVTRTARATLADEARATPEPEMFDRVVRVMTLIFLASVGVLVFVGGEYRDTEVAIQLLLAGGMLSVVLLQDLVPPNSLGRARHWVEALVAVAFVTALIGLTGGLMSPFVIGLFLVVAGASLSLDDAAPLLIALLAAGAYALVGIAVETPEQLTVAVLMHLVFAVISLGLLAYLASVVGREQRRAREAALSLSRFDPLTGLYNRGYFFSVTDREIRRAARNGSQFALLMLDLDELKPVNDTFGHQRGDELLRAVTGAIQRNVRSTDIAARYGGDEFVILLSDTEQEGAQVVAEKLRNDISSLAVGSLDRPARTSASIGVVTYPQDGTSIEALVADVDKAMYEAKRRGKNQIVGYLTRTERVATTVGEGRTTMMERREPRPAPTEMTQASRRTASVGGTGVSEPPGPAAAQAQGRMPAVRHTTPTTGPTASASVSAPGRAAPPPLATPVAPAAPSAPGGRAAWDSTAPAAVPAPVRQRQAERPYVAFPVERGEAGQRPAAPEWDSRDARNR